MTAKPVIPRERAVRDVEEILDYYLAEGSELAATGFIDALERAYAHIGEHPATGARATPPSWTFRICAPGRWRGIRTWSSAWSVRNISTSGACSTANAMFRGGCASRRSPEGEARRRRKHRWERREKGIL